jgi:hypothetical protein
MRDLTKIERTKKTYQLSKGEFVKGEWLKSVSDSDMLEIIYTGNNRILIVKDCVIQTHDGEQNGQDKQGNN